MFTFHIIFVYFSNKAQELNNINKIYKTEITREMWNATPGHDRVSGFSGRPLSVSRSLSCLDPPAGRIGNPTRTHGSS